MTIVVHIVRIGLVSIAVISCICLAVADPVSTPSRPGNDKNLQFARDVYDQVQRGHFTDAIDAANRAVTTQPNSEPARSVRSEVELVIGEYNAVIADASWLVDAYPDRPDAFLQRAAAHLLLHQAADAVADFDRALHSKMPLDAMNLGNVYALRSLAFEMLGRTTESIADFATASKALQPLASDVRGPVLNQRCYFAALIGLLETANIACEASINNDPQGLNTYPNAYSSRGALRLKTGAWDGAIADYTQSLKQQPGQSMMLYGRALARRARGDNAAANSDFALASAEEPNIRAIMVRLGFGNGVH